MNSPEALPVNTGARASRSSNSGSARPAVDFIRAMVEDDLRTGKHWGRVATRFPPEPNGYLHIGHAKSICLNFGIAAEHEGGTCNLRFDDTNPTTEDVKYAEAIERDVHWLGFDWEGRRFSASDYFERLYQYAVELVKAGKAYVDSLSEAEIREYRGTVTLPGKASPHRARSVDANLDLFGRMRAGEFADGTHVLRAKIDMASPNMLMRDPLLYRIRHARHYRTGDEWCIYPFYDFAHCLSDAIEGITHSLCTLEFKDNRELYDWILDALEINPRPYQTEFARLNLEHTVLSKRRLRALVEGGHVSGWDDPRMPTIAGLRRRGVTPEAIRSFCDLIGVARVDSRVDIGKLEFSVRDDLNMRVPRVMCVLRPLRVVIENYPAGRTEHLEAPYYPHDVPKDGSRTIPFTRELFIERDDFREDPPKGFFRMSPGREVRLRYGYVVKCLDVVKDPASGEVTEVRCSYDPATKGGNTPDGRKIRGTIHWVSAPLSRPATIRLYDRLFRVPNPDELVGSDAFIEALNPESLVTLTESRVEPSVASDPPGTRYQFERQGYFISDADESTTDALVFNRTVALRDTWAKVEAKRTAVAPVAPPRAPAPPMAPDGDGTSERRRPRRATLAQLKRYREELGIPEVDAEILVRDRALAEFFESALAVHDNPKHVAKWVINDVLRELKDRSVETLPVSGAQLGALVALVDDKTISRNIAKDVFAEMAAHGGTPEAIIEQQGLTEVSDPAALEPVVDRVVADNETKAAEYLAGRTGLLGFFVGQVMKASDGRANPKLVRELVKQRLTREPGAGSR